MNIRSLFFSLSTLLIFALAAGCERHDAKESSLPAEPFALSPDTVARVHWIGKSQLSIEAGGYYLMRIWELPSSVQLETQTLNKLSSALASNSFSAFSKSQRLSPEIERALWYNFLSDVLQNESFIEIRQPTNRPVEYTLAIRLDETRCTFWETNLAVLLQSITGTLARPSVAPDRGWTLKKESPAELIQLKRVAGWTIISAAQDKNPLLDELALRVRRYQKPFAQNETNWLEANMDLPRLSGALSLGWTLPAATPRLAISLTGDGGNVLARGNLTFPPEVKIEPEPWNIPRELIHQPLAAFSAMRGIKQPLGSWQLWNDLGLGTPDQACFWSEADGRFRSFFAMPLPDGGDRVRQLTSRLVSQSNPWLRAHGYVAFDPMANSNGVTWGNLPNVKPFITSTALVSGNFMVGGLFPEFSTGTNASGSNPLVQNLSSQTNLIYYNWELPNARLEPWLQIAQLARSLAHRSALPMNSVAVNWLGLVKVRLGESITEVALSGPHQLSFYRRSTVGLTAVELQLLVDWLESPQFPSSLHSTIPAP